MAHISIKNVSKQYDNQHIAVKDISLNIADKEFIALVGPSGCGKSTTLRMIAGLEDISAGEIWIGDKRVNGVLPRDRDIAMVFQNYALYPHKTVYDNIAFGLMLRRFEKSEINKRVLAAAETLGITSFLDRKPGALSGGQRQRVAMGRAMVRNPKAFLFDEPLSNLDAKLRVHMRKEIKKMHQSLQTTTIYVTHDQIEAMTLADRVVVMNHGSIEQIGPPQELYNHPATKFVAEFIGSPSMNFIPARLKEEQGEYVLRISDTVKIRSPLLRNDRYLPYLDQDLLIGLRPEHLTEYRETGKENAIRMDVNVDIVEPLGMNTLIYFSVGQSKELCALVDPSVSPLPGETTPLSADLSHLHLINVKTGIVL